MDVGSIEGTSWMLSSAKAQNGISQLTSDDVDTLWQSDGTQPHTVTIHFPRRTAVTHVSLYLDFLRDDSYTPTRVLVKAGTHPYDVMDVRYRYVYLFNIGRELQEPQGWYHFVLSTTYEHVLEEDEALENRRNEKLNPIEVFVLQICVLGNHLNGKDTHIRCLKVFGPPAPGLQRQKMSQSVSRSTITKRLVKQGMQTEAFRRQVERVGYHRAATQLERIMQQSSQNTPDKAPRPAQSSIERSLMSLSETLR